MEDLDEIILLQLRNISRDVAPFASALLSNTITHDEQISFAHRLVDLAEAVRERATGAAGQVVEGSTTDDRPDAQTAHRPADS
ncbi:MAG TPA: hypothetical protein VGP24_05595 [Glaciihabitans sp.]|jgi:hypothetical protein|nr:hypothetical protein [Glaciihabitans sp.]